MSRPAAPPVRPRIAGCAPRLRGGRLASRSAQRAVRLSPSRVRGTPRSDGAASFLAWDAGGREASVATAGKRGERRLRATRRYSSAPLSDSSLPAAARLHRWVAPVGSGPAFPRFPLAERGLRARPPRWRGARCPPGCLLSLPACPRLRGDRLRRADGRPPVVSVTSGLLRPYASRLPPHDTTPMRLFPPRPRPPRRPAGGHRPGRPRRHAGAAARRPHPCHRLDGVGLRHDRDEAGPAHAAGTSGPAPIPTPSPTAGWSR